MTAKTQTAKKSRPLTPPAEAPHLAALEKNGPLQIDVACIEPHPENPREDFDEGELLALAASMQTLSLMQPVLLTRAPGATERFQLIAGERRWRAAQLAGWPTISAYVVKADARIVVEMMVDENLQHKQLNPVETARAVERLTRPTAKGGAGLTHEQAAEKFAHQGPWATNILRLLKLPPAWQLRLTREEITVREARAIATYAERPDVLAAVDADRKSNPEDWRITADFERQLKFIVERLDGLTSAGAAGDDADGDTGEASDGQAIHLLRRSLPMNHAPAPAGAAEPRAVMPQEALRLIAELIEQFTDLDDLDRVQDLVAARAAILRGPAKRKSAKREPSHHDN